LAVNEYDQVEHHADAQNLLTKFHNILLSA
jgi:hypothetical protein